MMDSAGSGVGVGSGTGDGGGVGSGMFDAGTGPPIVVLGGTADAPVGVSAADAGVGLPVGGGLSPQADISTEAVKNSSPDRATRRPVPRKPTRTLEVGANKDRPPRIPY